jgi:hypothetical protein
MPFLSVLDAGFALTAKSHAGVVCRFGNPETRIPTDTWVIPEGYDPALMRRSSRAKACSISGDLRFPLATRLT